MAKDAKVKYKRPHKLKYGKWGLIFILPFFICYFLFQLYPLLLTFYNSMFTKYQDVFLNDIVKFVGFDNFKQIFTSGDVLKYFGNTAILWLLGFIPQIVVSLLFASWFTDIRLKLKGTGPVKVLLYLPNMLMASSVAVLFTQLFSVSGPINDILNNLFGLAGIDFINSEWGIRGLVALINFIMWTGNTTILLMAGIMGIDPSLYEASAIDGASAKKQFWKITIPMLKPIMLYVFVTSMIGGLQMYDIPRLLTDVTGGPSGVGYTVVMDISKGISGGDVGVAGAESVILFLVAGLIGIVMFKSMQSDDVKEKKAFKKAEKKARKLAAKGVQ